MCLIIKDMRAWHEKMCLNDTKGMRKCESLCMCWTRRNDSENSDVSFFCVTQCETTFSHRRRWRENVSMFTTKNRFIMQRFLSLSLSLYRRRNSQSNLILCLNCRKNTCKHFHYKENKARGEKKCQHEYKNGKKFFFPRKIIFAAVMLET